MCLNAKYPIVAYASPITNTWAFVTLKQLIAPRWPLSS